MEKFRGQCQCGEIEYIVDGDSLALFACHCSQCQRQSASAYGMALWVENYNRQIIRGNLNKWKRETPGGATMCCEFCPNCGARLFHQNSTQTSIISIKPGTLDNVKYLHPVAHIWVENAQSRMVFDEKTLLYPQNPSSFEDIFNAWAKEK